MHRYKDTCSLDLRLLIAAIPKSSENLRVLIESLHYKLARNFKDSKV